MSTSPQQNVESASEAVTHADAGSTTKLWTISNVITLTRICLVPLFVIVLVCPWPEWMGLPYVDLAMKRYIAAGIFILISATDWLDGYLARSRNEVTDFGKFMDPLADKILVAAALLALIELDSLPSWVALVILAREFIVSGVRMVAASKGTVIAASYIGKFKTVFQMIAIVLFTIKDAHNSDTISVVASDTLWLVSWTVMIIALILTIISMLDYIVKARDLIGLGPARSDYQRSEHNPATLPSADDMRKENQMLAQNVIERATAAHLTLGCAESLTGGTIAGTLTGIAGSSAVVRGGIVSYVNEVKSSVLGVDDDLLVSSGPVDPDVAEQMALGAKRALDCDIAVAVTGIAGPTGAEEGKPVGTVFMGVATPENVKSVRFVFEGDREQVRCQTVHAALEAFSHEILERF